jgi:hypothetical protein
VITLLFRNHSAATAPVRELPLLPPNGMDRSCAATIYPVLDKPRTTGAFQDRRKIGALLRPS